MVCALRSSVCVLLTGVIVLSQGIAVTANAKGSKEEKSLNSTSTSVAPITEFQWEQHKKLSWEDFRGPVNAVSDESAAATHCGMGFRVNTSSATGQPEVTVYNTFYINKSWVRPDAKIESILDHEQGHFDLCEIYTRKMRKMMTSFNFEEANAKAALMNIFTRVNNEYENRQQAYEYETSHGTNIGQQRKWQNMIISELN